jgi:[acyl-carrier-protein] S-malonyltransferase
MSHVAYIFPGQGSQSLCMLADIHASHKIVRDTFEEASSVLHYDLWTLIKEGPLERLNSTEFTQPALLAADVALWRLWCCQTDIRPLVMAGHSLGEYSALVASGAIAFSDAVNLVSVRGQCMQRAVEPGEGAMAAILGASDEQVKELCQAVKENRVLSPANFNSKGQVVVAGHADAVSRAVEQAREFGARMAKIIPVSVPSHCELMLPAEEPFLAAVNAVSTWGLPNVPVLHNTNVQESDSVDDVKESLVKQLTLPVRWVETIEVMLGRGVQSFVEMGPGQVLKGLNKRICKQVPVYSLHTLNEFEQAIAKLEELV